MKKVQFDEEADTVYNNRFVQKSIVMTTTTSTIFQGWDSFTQKNVIIKKVTPPPNLSQ